MANLKTLPKMHLACATDNLRPAIEHVLVTKDETVASDTHILVIHKTNKLFSEEFVEKMPERFLIHKNIWREMCKQHVSIDFENGMIKVQRKLFPIFLPVVMEENVANGNDTEVKLFKLEKNFYPFPNYKSIFTATKEPVGAIGIRTDYLNNLSEALFYPNEVNTIKMEFNDQNHYIKVTPRDNDCMNNHNSYSVDNESYAVIMPLMLNDE